MRELISQYLPWLLSLLSLIMVALTGNLHRKTWVFGIGIQFLWLLWIWSAKAWGFLPLTLALFGMYARNHFKWKKL
jgi:hypothetical protein